MKMESATTNPSETTIQVYDAMCCTKYPMMVGFPGRRCGKCGEVPVGIPNTRRTIVVENSQHPPKLVATVAR